LARLLPEILPGIARFDLAADPIEDRPLPIDRRTFAPDWRAIEEAITHTRRGLELRFVGTGTFAVRVEGLGRASVIEPFALEEDDRWTRSRSASGSAFQARLDLSDGVDGFRIEDASPGGVRITAETECGQLRLAGARPVELSSGVASEVPRAAIPAGIPDFEAPGPCAGVFLWRAEGRARSRTAAEEEETVKKLRALGYLH
jgi:hypothetical protein